MPTQAARQPANHGEPDDPDHRSSGEDQAAPAESTRSEVSPGSEQFTMLERFRGFYGAHPLHLLGVLAGFALLGYIISVVGPAALWNTSVWWQSILVWFLGAVVLHDLVLFPLYAIADRTHTAGLRALRGRRARSQPRVPATNYVRVPVLASGLLFLVFFPGIIEQGSTTYLAATGQTQAPFLARWLLAVAVIFAISALTYTVRWATSYRRSRPTTESPRPPAAPAATPAPR